MDDNPVSKRLVRYVLALACALSCRADSFCDLRLKRRGMLVGGDRSGSIMARSTLRSVTRRFDGGLTTGYRAASWRLGLRPAAMPMSGFPV